MEGAATEGGCFLLFLFFSLFAKWPVVFAGKGETTMCTAGESSCPGMTLGRQGSQTAATMPQPAAGAQPPPPSAHPASDAAPGMSAWSRTRTAAALGLAAALLIVPALPVLRGFHLLNAASADLRRGHLIQAEQAARLAVAELPWYGPAREVAAQAYTRLGFYALEVEAPRYAIQLFREALALEPAQRPAYMGLAQAYLALAAQLRQENRAEPAGDASPEPSSPGARASPVCAVSQVRHVLQRALNLWPDDPQFRVLQASLRSMISRAADGPGSPP